MYASFFINYCDMPMTVGSIHGQIITLGVFITTFLCGDYCYQKKLITPLVGLVLEGSGLV